MTPKRASALERLSTPRAMRLLIELEEVGGIGAAARAVGMTQPSASRLLARLEAELGFPLVHRTRLGSTLTSEGAAVIGQAREVLASYRRFEELARSLDSRVQRGVLLAASRTVGEHLAPHWLANLAREMPEIRASFHIDNSQAVIDDVLSGKVVLGFVETPHLPEEISYQTVRHDRLVVIAPAGTDTPKTIDWHELSKVALVEREPGSGTRAMLEEYAPNRAAPIVQFDSNTAIVQAVSAGVGWAVLSELAVHDALAEGRLREIEWRTEAPRRALRAIWHTASGLSKVAAQILQALILTNDPGGAR